jgi:SAM-dependent methyltransferase
MGTFDLVFCGSLLLHLTDPLRALEGIRRVARGDVIVATAIYDEPLLRVYEAIIGAGLRVARRRTRVKFSALVRNDMNDSFWIPTHRALVDMVRRAGFRDVRLFSTFNLERTNGRRGWRHGVVHARV